MEQVRGRRRPTRVAFGRLGLACLLALGVLVMSGGTASAHVRLESSDPAAGVVLASPPQAVTLTFDELVDARDGSILVYDDQYRPVATGPTSAVPSRPDQLRVSLSEKLARGTYIVSWRVSSTDTHPVTGVFRFSVGAATPVSGSAPDIGQNDTAGAIMGPLRWLGYVGLAVGPGALVVVLWLWPTGLSTRRIRRLLVAGMAALATSTVGGMLMQGVYASGQPLSALWTDPSVLDTHSHTFDTVYAVRIYLLVALAGVVAAALSVGRGWDVRPRKGRGKELERDAMPSGRRGLLAGTVVATVAVTATWPVAGHAAASQLTALTLAFNLFHTLAMVVWLGGLAAILAGLGLPEHRATIARALPRFSRLALVSVATLVVTGSYLAWSEVGAPAAVATTYGRVLVVKLVVVAALVALGDLARRWVARQGAADATELVPPHAATTDDEAVSPASAADDTRRLRAGLAGESLLAAGVLALSSALVVIVPARADYVEPWSQTLTAGGSVVTIELPSPRVGDTVARLLVTSGDGRVLPVSKASGSVAREGGAPAPALAPLPVTTEPGDGAPSEIGLTFASGGRWVVRLSLTTGGGPATPVSFTVPVVARS